MVAVKTLKRSRSLSDFRLTGGRCYDHYVMSAIFANFRRKDWRFSYNPML
jgi:hypothetical protein